MAEKVKSGAGAWKRVMAAVRRGEEGLGGIVRAAVVPVSLVARPRFRRDRQPRGEAGGRRGSPVVRGAAPGVVRTAGVGVRSGLGH